MLRKRLEDDIFWKAVQDYIHRYLVKTVETEDFRKVLEEHSSLNLNKFFDQWLYSKGYPRLKFTLLFNDTTKSAKVTVKQTQVNKEEGIGLFDIRVPITIIDENGKSFSKTVELEEETEASSVTFELTANVRTLEIDPHNHILFEVDGEMEGVGEEVLVNNIIHSSSLFNQIYAARALVKKAVRPSINRLKSALSQVRGKAHYGLFAEVAEVLSSTPTDACVELYCELLGEEKDPHALVSFTQASQSFGKDERVRNALLKLLKDESIGYRSKTRAMQGLANQKNEEDFEYFVSEANREKGWLQMERSAALAAIATFHNERAFEELSKRLEHGKEPQESRAAAVTAFASAAASLSDKKKRKEAKERLLKLAGEGNNSNYNYPVRKAAVLGLVAFEEEDVVPTIESLRPLFSNQDQPWLTRRVTAIKNAKKDDQASLKKELNTLKEKVAELEKKFEKKENK